MEFSFLQMSSVHTVALTLSNREHFLSNREHFHGSRSVRSEALHLANRTREGVEPIGEAEALV